MRARHAIERFERDAEGGSERAQIGFFVEPARGNQDPVGAGADLAGPLKRCIHHVGGQEVTNAVEFASLVISARIDRWTAGKASKVHPWAVDRRLGCNTRPHFLLTPAGR